VDRRDDVVDLPPMIVPSRLTLRGEINYVGPIDLSKRNGGRTIKAFLVATAKIV